jgi:DNA topoisomerase-2
MTTTKRAKVEYTMMDELTHILERPDTQVGSIDNKMISRALIFNPSINAFDLHSDLVVCPALGKLVDELLVNVADHKTRNPKEVKRCKVSIDTGTGEISVWNDGPGIDVEIHPEWGIYKAQGIFGNLRSSSNFDDGEQRYTGGRNGYGAKLCNIFSTKFTVETCDGHKKYKQSWSDNMSKVGKPSVRTMASKNPNSFTQISFIPDWPRFGEGVDGWSSDMILWIATRCAELAGTKPKLELTFQTTAPPVAPSETPVKTVTKMAVRGFRSFSNAVAKALVPDDTLGFCDVNDRWAVGLAPSEGSMGLALSFVNSISTPNEGTHVRHVRNQLVKAIKQKLKKEYPTLRASNGLIETHLLLTINCMVSNPTFGSQTKEELALPSAKFGVKCAFTAPQLSKLLKDSNIVQVIADRSKGSKFEEPTFEDAKKSRSVSVDKLEDAMWAGGAKSGKCTLILTEGDSAKALAVAGLAVVGRQTYGVFPLRGKPLNVRQAAQIKIKNNAEIQNIIKIMGLRRDVDYRDAGVRATMRYGSMMIMADQDDDGTHIKSLVINFVAVFNKTLLTIPFLSQFVTPVLRARKGTTVVKSFYSTPEYDKWAKTVNIDLWKIKYYKGLGTSTSAEAREYFRDLERHLIPFDIVDIDHQFVSLVTKYAPDKTICGKRKPDGGGGSKEDVGDLDPESWNGLQWLEMAFEKDLADLRKAWLVKTPVPENEVPIGELGNFATFFNTAYRLYCQVSIVRAIPSVFDGLKRSQRKILYMAFIRKNSEIKVESFAGMAQERVNYHHGAVSLQGAMIGMAQNYAGSNNLNLLQPLGQFGTRLQGGKDHAAPRYIFTKLDPVARVIFPAVDDAVLTYQHEEGMDIEPAHYMPVIPMSLVNGSNGMGTGWSSNIPTFDPLAIITVTESYLKTGLWDRASELTPFVRGFEGAYIPTNSTDACELVASMLVGKVQLKGATLVVTELPPGKWATPFLAFAEANVVCKGGKPPVEVRTLGTESKINFQIALSKETVDYYDSKKSELCPVAFEKLLVDDWKLASKADMRTTMAYLLDEHGSVKGYTVCSILETHAVARMALYEARKVAILKGLDADMRMWELKARFVGYLLDDTLAVRKRALIDIKASMVELGFDEADHSMLLGLPLKVQTEESVKEWAAKIETLRLEVVRVTGITAIQFWVHDLKELRKAVLEQNAALVKSLTE